MSPGDSIAYAFGNQLTKRGWAVEDSLGTMPESIFVSSFNTPKALCCFPPNFIFSNMILKFAVLLGSLVHVFIFPYTQLGLKWKTQVLERELQLFLHRTITEYTVHKGYPLPAARSRHINTTVHSQIEQSDWFCQIVSQTMQFLYSEQQLFPVLFRIEAKVLRVDYGVAMENN